MPRFSAPSRHSSLLTVIQTRGSRVNPAHSLSKGVFCGDYHDFLLAHSICLVILQMSLQRGINLRALAEKMGNCSGAEVRGICTEAGEFAFIQLKALGVS